MPAVKNRSKQDPVRRAWRRGLSPPQLLSVHLLGLLTAGGLLLSLPISAAPGRHIAVLDAFFTSTSAVCVTGLTVLDTPKALSLFGQIVLMLLIQAGGLGYMTLTTIVATALGKRFTLQERLTLHEALNLGTMDGVFRFALRVIRMTLVIEALGALILAVRWMGPYGVWRGLFLGAFHAVSAFNNAGFALFSDNLMGFRGDVTVNLVITGLIISGGLGFVVLSELGRWRSRVQLSVHTKLVLVVTGALLGGAMIAIYLLERQNPRSLAGLGPMETLLAVWFQSVTPRTAGFNTLDLAGFTPPTLFVIVFLMFIGASPGGTGGGVKTTSFGIVLAALWSTMRRGEHVVIFHRRLPMETVLRAFFISLIAFLAMNLVAGLLLITESTDLLPTIFEAASAFGTVGLSMGHPGSVLSQSGHYSAVGKVLIMALMFVGRIGPLTLAVALAVAAPTTRVRYPEGKVLVG